MRVLREISYTFEASHRVEGHPDCDKDHGHSWELFLRYQVEDNVEREVDALLYGLVQELDGRNINSQLPVSSPTAEGIGRWAWERLDMLVEGIDRVVVERGSGLEWVIIERS